MNNVTKKIQSLNRRRTRVRARFSGTPNRPRLRVFRSNTSIYAQIIDDTQGKTLASEDSRKLKGKKAEVALQVGKAIAQKATALGISEVVFDRGGYLYHGRVKALAEGAREGGLKF